MRRNPFVKKFTICITLLFTFFVSAFAQKTFEITGAVNGMPAAKIYFRYYTGNKATYSDSVISKSGKFVFTVPDSLRGLCAIRAHNIPSVNIPLITSGENIGFYTSFNDVIDSIHIITSQENKAYYNYFAHRENLPPNTPLASLYIKLQRPVTVPHADQNKQYLRDHFLDNIDLRNALIIHTNLLEPQLLNYLALFNNTTLPFAQQADTLCVALDALMKLATDAEVYNFLVTELSNRFRYGDYDVLCAYLTKYYASRFTLVRDYPVNEIQQRIQALVHPMIGQPAPDFVLNDTITPTKMSGIKVDHLLLVFWSTGCIHCMHDIPALKKIFDIRRGSFAVLAIDMDTDRAAHKKYINDNSLNWINDEDARGFESKTAEEYDLQGTPTFILLDKNKVIIAKPATLQDLEDELKRLKII